MSDTDHIKCVTLTDADRNNKGILPNTSSKTKL